MNTAAKQFEINMKDTEFAEWYNSRPEIVKNTIRNYPFMVYEVMKGSPYGISAPGTKVFLYSYLETGMIRVVVPSKNLTEEGKSHLKRLSVEFNKNYEEMILKDHLVEIDPQYLSPIE